ncbi:MAG: DUF983 domain-containing protein [Planctomycetota bacterium]|jgi:uncharacterized protein (DUF983 family)
MKRVNLLKTLLWRGLRQRCPQCGNGRVFTRWHTVREHCSECGLDLDSREGNTWAFMYISTAGLTGVFFVIMLLTKPENLVFWQIVLFTLAMLVIVGTLPMRKSIAIALDYLSELLWDNHRDRKVRHDHEESNDQG